MAELRHYIRQRLNAWPLLPLTAMIFAPGLLAHTNDRMSVHGLRALAVLLTVAALRLLDDLADRVHDQERHPDRVLCRARQLRPFWVLLGVLLVSGLLCLTALYLEPWRPLLVVGVVTALGLHYRARPTLECSRLFNAQLVLLKYPALVIASWPVGGSLGAATHAALPSAVLVFALLLTHEWLTDGEVRAARGARLVVAAQLLGAFALGWLWRFP